MDHRNLVHTLAIVRIHDNLHKFTPMGEATYYPELFL